MPMSIKKDTKIIYSFRIKNLLEIQGFKPILETNNPYKSGFKCWIFEATPDLLKAFDELLRKEE